MIPSIRLPGRAWLAAGTAAVATAALTVLAPAAATAAPAAVIDGSATYQRIDGFGSSEAFGEASLVEAAPAAARRQVFRLLYSRAHGAGMTILRNLIPSDTAHTIEPTAPASPASLPAYRPLGSDWGQVWFTRRALRSGVRTVYADAWSAPGFMKTNGSEAGGGTLCGVPGAGCASGDWRQAFASYLVRYLRDYRADGIRVNYLGFENEPNLTTSYSSMVMSPAQSAAFAGVLGPTLARSGLGTRLACCDAEGWNYAPSYTAAVTTGPVPGRYVSLITSHGYTAPPTSPLPARGRPVWETEWSTFQPWDPAWDDGTTASGFSWAQNIYRGLTAARLNGFLYWWGTSTPAMNGDNESLIQLNGSTVTPSGRLWAFTAFSRFIRPGAVRLGATSPVGGLEVTAFRNPGGSLAIVAVNTTTGPLTVPVSLRHTGPRAGLATPCLTDASHDTAAQPPLPVRGGAFTATVPPRAVVSYLIRPGRQR